MLWSIRVVYDSENVQAVLIPSSISKWLNNITVWQGCNGKAPSRGQCSVRKPFTALPLWDGDYVKTNLVQHPILGGIPLLKNILKHCSRDRCAKKLPKKPSPKTFLSSKGPSSREKQHVTL
jgi:hypothetical protein